MKFSVRTALAACSRLRSCIAGSRMCVCYINVYCIATFMCTCCMNTHYNCCISVHARVGVMSTNVHSCYIYVYARVEFGSRIREQFSDHHSSDLG